MTRIGKILTCIAALAAILVILIAWKTRGASMGEARSQLPPPQCSFEGREHCSEVRGVFHEAAKAYPVGLRAKSVTFDLRCTTPWGPPCTQEQATIELRLTNGKVVTEQQEGFGDSLVFSVINAGLAKAYASRK